MTIEDNEGQQSRLLPVTLPDRGLDNQLGSAPFGNCTGPITVQTDTWTEVTESTFMRRSIWISLFVLFIYFLSYSSTIHSIDELATVSVAESLLHGTMQVNRMEWEQERNPAQNAFGLDGNLYSKKGLGVPLVTLPILSIAKLWPNSRAVQFTLLGTALLSALTVFFFYHLVMSLDYSPTIGTISALALGLGTLLWPYSKWLFSEPFAAFGLCLALLGLVKFFHESDYPWLLVVSLGLAILTLGRSSNAILAPPFALAVFYKLIVDFRQSHDHRTLLKGAIYFGLIFGLIVLGIVALNYFQFGTFLSYPRTPGESFTTPISVGLSGLLWSSGRGILFFVPMTWLIGLSYLINGRKMLSPLYLVAMAVVLTAIFFYGRWYDWPGGQAWGTRFLVPTMPAIVMLCLPAFAWLAQPGAPGWRRWLLGGWLGLTFLAQVPGVLKNFQQQELIDGGLGQSFQELLWSWPHSPLLTYWGTLLNGAEDPIWLRSFFWSNPPWFIGLLAFVGLMILVLHLQQAFFINRNSGRQPSRSRLLWLGIMTIGFGLGMVVAARSDPRWTQGSDIFADNQEVRAWIDDHTLPRDIVLLDLPEREDPSARIWEWINFSSSKPDYIGWQRKAKFTDVDKARLEMWLAPYGRVLLTLQVTPYAAPDSTTENWLRQWTYEGENQWFNTQRITEFYLPDPGGEILSTGTAAWFDEQPLQVTYTVRSGRIPEIALIELSWTQSTDRDVKFSIQALDAHNNLLQQVDRSPSIDAGDRDRVGLKLTTPDTNLILKIYDTATGAVIPARLDKGQEAEYLTIARIP